MAALETSSPDISALEVNTLEGVDKDFSDTFGNYLLHGIAEVQLPDEISWLPQTTAWKVLFLVLLIAFGYGLFKRFTRWQANTYRRQALKQLDSFSISCMEFEGVLEQLPKILKATALQAYPRSNVAQLSGQQWLEFLDQQYPSSHFNSDIGRQLLAVSYENQSHWQVEPEQVKALIAAVALWVENHSSAIVDTNVDTDTDTNRGADHD